MIMPPARETLVSLTLVVSVPAVRVSLVDDRSRAVQIPEQQIVLGGVADPTAEATQPHGCSAASSSTANGMVSAPFSSKYHASSGMSYSQTISMPAVQSSSSPSMLVTRLMK